MIIWAGVMLILQIIFVPETYHPTLLRSKVQRLRKETGDEKYHTVHDETKIHTLPGFLRAVGHSCKTPIKLLLLEPIVFLLCLCTAILLAIVYLFFEVIDLIYVDLYG